MSKKKYLQSLLEENNISDPEKVCDLIWDNFKIFKKKLSAEDFKFPDEDEALRDKLYWVEVNFMVRVLGIEKWMVSSLSSLGDMWPANDIECARGLGKTPGTFQFKTIWVDSEGEEGEEVWVEIPKNFRRKVIVKTLEIFGVNPAGKIDGYLVDLFQFLDENMPDDKRKECEEWYEKDKCEKCD